MGNNQDLNLEKQKKQIKENFEVFMQKLPELLKTNKGEYVLMKDRKIIKCFKSLEEAHKKGAIDYEDGIFSIQEVKEMPVDLGWFSHVHPII